MELASIVNQYYDAFMIRHGDTALPGHLKALNRNDNLKMTTCANSNLTTLSFG